MEISLVRVVDRRTSQMAPFFKRYLSFATRALLGVGDQVSLSAVTFLLSLCIGRSLGADGLGLFALTNALFLFTLAIQNSLIFEPFSVFGPREPNENVRQYAAILLCASCIVSLLISVVTYFVSIMFSTFIPAISQMKYLLAACLFYCACNGIQTLLRRYFYVCDAARMAFRQSFLYFLLCSMLLALLYFSDHLSLFGAYAVLSVCSILVFARNALSLFTPPLKLLRTIIAEYMRKHWRYGRWSLATSAAWLSTFQAYFLIGGYVLSVEDIGFLKGGEALLAPFMQVAVGINMVLVPTAARRFDGVPTGKKLTLVLNAYGPLIGLGMLYSGVLYLFGGKIIDFLFADRLGGTKAVLPFLALVPTVWAMSLPPTLYFALAGKLRITFMCYVVSALVSLTFGVYMMVMFGLVGAAIGFVISWTCVTAFLWLQLVLHWRKEVVDDAKHRGAA